MLVSDGLLLFPFYYLNRYSSVLLLRSALSLNFICMQLKEKETAYYFYIAEGIGHSLSYSPMKDNRHDILSFLNRLVLGKEKRCITTVEKNPEISRYKSDFTIEDYIRENMR